MEGATDSLYVDGKTGKTMTLELIPVEVRGEKEEGTNSNQELSSISMKKLEEDLFTKRQKHEKVTCPISACSKKVVDIRRHLILVHKWENSKAKKAKLNLGLCKIRSRKSVEERKSRFRKYVKKICPVEKCSSVVARLENHLRQVHKISDQIQFREYMKSAKLADETFDKKSFLDSKGEMEFSQKDLFFQWESSDNNQPMEDNGYTMQDFCAKQQYKEAPFSPPSIFAGSGSGSEECEDQNDWEDQDEGESDEERESTGEGGDCGETSCMEGSVKEWKEVWSLSFRDWLMSPDGGHKKLKDAMHNVIQITGIVVYLGSFFNIFVKDFLWTDWLKKFEHERKPGTIKSYLNSLQLFYKFIISQAPPFVTLPVEAVIKLKESVHQWSKSYAKVCLRRKWEKEMEDIPKLITPQEIDKLDSSEEVREVTKIMGRLSSGIYHMTKSEFTAIRDFLITSLCLDNATRTGAIANMKLGELESAVRDGESMVVSVLDHKTVATSGPAALCMPLQIFQKLSLFAMKARKSTAADTKKDSFVFVSWNGLPMTSSNITQQFNSFWQKAVGETTSRKRVNASLVRKSCVTAVHKKHPDLKVDLANLMNHSVKTAESTYFLQNKLEAAAKTSQELRKIMRGKETITSKTAFASTSSEHVPSDDVLQNRFDAAFQKQSISMETVKKEILDSPDLMKCDPRKLYERVRYLMHKRAMVPPAEEESREDKIRRMEFGTSISLESSNTEPFTEASSSTCNSRVRYSSSENALLMNTFRSMIESDCVIRGKDILRMIKEHPDLTHLLERYSPHQLVDKVRTARKSYQRRAFKN